MKHSTLWTVLTLAAALIVFAIIAFPRGAAREPPACAARDFEGSRFIVCTYDTARDELRLVSRDVRGAYVRNFAALTAHLGADVRRLRFAMNAGMYDETGAPIGLFVAEGAEEEDLSRTDGPGNFHMKPNGVFWQSENGDVHVDTADIYAAEPRAARWATQSGPMLVIDGELHPRFQPDGPSRYLRNGVGVRGDRTAYFVISSGVVSFGRVARFFRDELDCDDALFLDGSVSSLWSPELDRRDETSALGPMIVVLAR
jgi:uncharacterized protein YigE (DUF2233 family)